MATKATAKPSAAVAVVKAKVNLPANINEQFANEVAGLQKRLSAPSGNMIKVTKAKTFRLPNGLEVEELECVIVDFVAEHRYYKKAFDKDNITPPDCIAIGLEPSSLVPSENSLDKQCESCAACWANQFKSAPNGRAKACSNNRLMAVIPLDADADTQVMLLRASSTALKSFDGHVGSVASKYGVPIRGVTTRISFSDDDYASLRFAVIDKLSAKDPLLAVAQSLKESATALLLTEPEMAAPANDEPVRRAPAKKVARRA